MTFSLSGCSPVKTILTKIPIFEEADMDSLTGKAEKAWEEVGKDALKDAAADAADSIFGKDQKLEWPIIDSTKDVPIVNEGTISKVDEKNSITEIVIKEISLSGYSKYVSALEEKFGSPISKGIFRYETRLISAIYDEEKSSLTITISTIKQNIDVSVEESEADTPETSKNN